jgi:phage protein U
MSTFAILGEIVFEVLTSPESFRSMTDYHYAEHKVVEARPRLQWMALELQKISLELGFHIKFTNPATQMNRLRKAAEDHQARALVFGNGVHRGYFVIESIEETHQQLAGDGSFIAISAKIELAEWVQGAEFDPLAPPRRATPPPGIVRTTGTGANLTTVTHVGNVTTTTVGSPTVYNPNLPIGPHNLAPANVITGLNNAGVTAGVMYSPTPYSRPGVSALVGSGPTAAPPGNIGNVSTATITRAG